MTWVLFWVWLLMGVNVARLVGEGAAVVVHPDAVRCVVAHGVRNTRRGRGLPIYPYDSGVWWCCSAPDVLARLPVRIKREKKRKKGKERKGKENRVGRETKVF